MYLAPSSASHSPDNSRKSSDFLPTPPRTAEQPGESSSFGNQALAALERISELAGGPDAPTTAARTPLTDSQRENWRGNRQSMRLSHISSEGSRESSFFRKDEFLDPLVRITQMKFMTSAEIHIAHGVKFACLDIRLKKAPRLTEIFKRPSLNKSQR